MEFALAGSRYHRITSDAHVSPPLVTNAVLVRFCQDGAQHSQAKRRIMGELVRCDAYGRSKSQLSPLLSPSVLLVSYKPLANSHCPLRRSPQRPQRSQTATISALADILASTAHIADAPRPPPIIATESNRASPRRDATATANSATYQSQDSQDSEPDTPLLPGCSVMAPPPKPDGAASPAKLAIGVVGIFGARPASFLRPSQRWRRRILHRRDASLTQAHSCTTASSWATS